jgi:hypothetical protein
MLMKARSSFIFKRSIQDTNIHTWLGGDMNVFHSCTTAINFLVLNHWTY